MRTLVLGAGAVGTTLAGFLARGGHEVTLWLRPQRIAAWQHVEQLVVAHAETGELLRIPRPALTAAPALQNFDALLICVKHSALPALLARLPPTLPAGLTLLSTLNGVSAAQQLAARFPGTPVIPVTIMFNARVDSPLHSTLTTRAEVHVGSNAARWLQLFATGGLKVKAVDAAAMHGKLLINLNNALCALTHTTFKEVLSEPAMRQCFVMVMDEAVAVMRQTGQTFTLPVPMPYALYRRFILHGGALPWWVARVKNGLTRSAYPSMVADIEAGHITEVEQLNGAVVALGQRMGIHTPVNAQVLARITALQQRPQGTAPRYLSTAELLNDLRSAAHAQRQ